MIFPAIDLIDGKCVRLYKGDFDQRTDYAMSPVDMARQFAAEGAEWIHIVDLDGAKNQASEQSGIIIEIAQKSGLKVQTGGGLRHLETIKNLLAQDIERVVIGSLAISDPKRVQSWMVELGPEKIVLALDVNIDADGIPYPAKHGWLEKSDQSLWDVIEAYQDSGLKTILVTDIAKDGVLQGANVNLYRSIQARYPGLDLITSGGVGELSDVRDLKALSPHGVIIGKALYENRFSLADAISC